MYIYQRVQVLKVKFRVRIENLGFAIGTLTYGENAYQYSSVIWTQKQANDAVTAGVTSFDSIGPQLEVITRLCAQLLELLTSLRILSLLMWLVSWEEID